MKENLQHRKLLKDAIAKIGADVLPSRQLSGMFGHEGNRQVFSELKHAEEDFLLQAILRKDRDGNVAAGGDDSIAEGAMRNDEATMRATSAEIILDDDEADRLIDAYVSLVRATFHLPRQARVPREARSRSGKPAEASPARDATLRLRGMLADLFKRRRRAESQE